MAARTLPDAEYLHQCFLYDPSTGGLTWRTRPLEHFKAERGWKRWNTRYADTQAGLPRPLSGYVYVSIRKRQSAVHRIAWKMMTGEDPLNEIDHINRDPADNRFINLRSVATAHNNKNKGNYRNNKLGFKGVALVRKTTHPYPYLARIRINGDLIHLGYFKTAEEAHEMYASAAKVYFQYIHVVPVQRITSAAPGP